MKFRLGSCWNAAAATASAPEPNNVQERTETLHFSTQAKDPSDFHNGFCINVVLFNHRLVTISLRKSSHACGARVQQRDCLSPPFHSCGARARYWHRHRAQQFSIGFTERPATLLQIGGGVPGFILARSFGDCSFWRFQVKE